MIGWLIGAGGMLFAFGMWVRERNRPAPAPLALPPSPLNDRLYPLLRSLQGIRAATRDLTAEDMLLCAPPGASLIHEGGDLGASMVGVHWNRTPRGGDGVGPGRRMFIQVHQAIAGVEADDRRDLAEAGFSLDRLIAALEPVGEAEPWQRRLLAEIDALEKTLGQIRHQPYR
ncbi:MAG: hypothetical protein AAF799_30000 [Myxococcota bacterium]